MDKNCSQSWFFILFVLSAVSAQQYWYQSNPLPTSETINKLLYADGKLYACGTSGTLLNSNNAVDWQKMQTGIQNSLSSVAVGNNKYVIVGGNELYESSDGSSWQHQIINWHGSALGVHNVFYGNGKFVIGCRGGNSWDTAVICYSTDGIAWTPVSLNVEGHLTRYAYNDSMFVVFGDDIIATSKDCISWSTQVKVKNKIIAMIWAENRFIGVGIDSAKNYAVFTSNNGVTWVSQRINTRQYLKSIAWNGKQFVILAGSFNDSIFTSPDGISWTRRTVTGTHESFNCIASMRDTFVIAGDVGSIFTSADAINWTPQNHYIFGPHIFNGFYKYGQAQRVIWADNRFVVIGTEQVALGSNTYEDIIPFVLTSPDGTSWTYQRNDSLAGLYLVWGNNEYVSMRGRSVSVSNDGKTWKGAAITQDSTVQLNGIVWGGTKFVAVGSSYNQIYDQVKIYSSPDGLNWVECQIGSVRGNLRGISYGNGTFVAVGRPLAQWTGLIFTSIDGINWTKSELPDAMNGLTSIWWVKDRHIAIGVNGSEFYQSSDGMTWTLIPVTPRQLYCDQMLWANNQYLILNYSGMYSSPDAINWTKQITNCTGPLNSIAYGANQFVAVGDNCTIINSPAATPVIYKKPIPSVTSHILSFCGNSIRYSVTRSCPIGIRLFDIRGRLTATLVNTFQPAGQHAVALPRNLAQGRYVVSLRAGSIKVDKAMVIAR